MKTLIEITDKLSPLHDRHNAFKNIFNTFQNNIKHLYSGTYPVKGITLIEYNEEQTCIAYIDREYEIKFLSGVVNNSFKGIITFSCIINNEEIKEITRITYNGQSIVDIEQPQGEDPISLNEEGHSLNLVLNWLSTEINA